MLEAGAQKPISSCYVPILQECLEPNSASRVEPLHAHMMKTGFSQDYFLMTLLINVYAKRGSMAAARKVFDTLPNRNVVTWTTLMTGYVHNSQPKSAIPVFMEMLEVGVSPTNYTLGTILNACLSLYDIGLGKQIHAYAIKYGLEHDESILNVLYRLYTKCRSLDMALSMFTRTKEKNVILCTALITACAENGNSAMGLDTFIQMLEMGVLPNEITLTSVLSLCCTAQALDLGTQVHGLTMKLGYGSDIPVMTAVMYLYLKNRFVSWARKIFDEMSDLGLVTWNAMIAGYGDMSLLMEDRVLAYLCGVEALKIFQRMIRSGLKPDFYTYSSMLTICSSLVALDQGEQVHAQIIKTGILSEMVVGTALVNMYNKCGSIVRACRAFTEMPGRTLISWTTMINALVQHGYSLQALDLFDDMRFVGVRPNKVTFVGVLSACSQLGLVDRALTYYEMMQNTYKIRPVVGHLGSMVDMFVRLGRIDEAFEFIEKSDTTPNEFVWSILIAGCRVQGKMDSAFYAAEKLLELKPKDPEMYFQLLNMYLSARRWEDVARVRKMMKEQKVDKVADWSWTSIRDKVYAFKSGDKKHEGDEVGKFLEDLVVRARDLGYEGELGSEMVGHSERMAVAFGLLNTSGNAEVRVVKKIGMCRDCHSFMKTVSVLMCRTIVVRDSKRLHQFSQGQCSCKDFGGFV
ncbi:Pentatricopeptide repeat-containing protein [Striga hermonthica]|uniref:Pentatricopeptide repeat-containing protein n=1 Tax=Striga hermonthica TaxID=68872 RepID=A0A9N7MPA7_STRHE|nr:Pentatricopeptide repeat-containing protein [Striga hermonthica]